MFYGINVNIICNCYELPAGCRSERSEESHEILRIR